MVDQYTDLDVNSKLREGVDANHPGDAKAGNQETVRSKFAEYAVHEAEVIQAELAINVYVHPYLKNIDIICT